MDSLYATREQGFFGFLDLYSTAVYSSLEKAKITFNTIKNLGLKSGEISQKESESVAIIEVEIDLLEEYGIKVIGPYLES